MTITKTTRRATAHLLDEVRDLGITPRRCDGCLSGQSDGQFQTHAVSCDDDGDIFWRCLGCDKVNYLSASQIRRRIRSAQCQDEAL